MATPTIPNGKTQFFPIIYSGNGQGQRVGKFVSFTNNGTIAKSCMFNDGDSAYLEKTFSGAGNKKTFTISLWLKRCTLGARQDIWSFNQDVPVTFMSDNTLRVFLFGATALQTNRTFEDTSKWYHVLLRVDSTQSTADDRVRLYVDGDQITSFGTRNNPSQDADASIWTSGTDIRLFRLVGGTNYYDGYAAEINYADGQSYGPDTFGVTDSSTGRWIPKTLTGITYGTNGFRLEFGTSSALGDDTSGNTNDFSVSNLVAGDQRNDTPTNNLPTFRPYNPSYSQVLYEGNLTHYTNGTNKGYPMVPTLRPKGSGKYYAECRVSGDGGGNTVDLGVFLQEDMHNYSSGNYYPGNNNGSGWNSVTSYADRGFYQQVNGTNTFVKFISETIAGGDVIGMALDIDNGLLSYYNNSGSLVGSVPFDNNKTPMFAATSNTSITFIWNFGDNGTFAGNETAGGNADEDGNGNFYHSVPSGFKMLTQNSMPETDKGISGLTWIKDRDNASYYHTLVDSSRGANKELYSNDTSVEASTNDSVTKFLKGGVAVEDAVNVNNSGDSFVSWNWVANGGTTASNSNGSIASTTQVNSTAGFSIVTYTGTGSNATVGHGLSSVPKIMLFKNREHVEAWYMYHKDLPSAEYYLMLNYTNAQQTASTLFQSTAPTSSVFSIGTADAYCWDEVDGFSKFGKYTANNNVDGPFIYTGFKPAFVMVKNIDSAYSWFMFDNARDPSNPVSNFLAADQTTVYSSQAVLDFVSNGFKIRVGNASGANHLTNTHVYMAFAEHPFVGDGTNPVTAR